MKNVCKLLGLLDINKWERLIRNFRCSRKFSHRPKKLIVGKNTQIFHPEHIEIGDHCTIGSGTAICPLHTHRGKQYPSKIVIGNNVNLGAYDRIASAYSVTIEDDVLLAAFVHITDHSHGFEDITQPIMYQDIIHKGPIVIGKGSWLAFGCHVLSGVKIGEHCVVAANAVVTRDVPPYSVVAGNPARIVKQYDFEKKQWVKL